MSRYFLHLAFNGTQYCGWQIQPKVSTVQETLERVLAVFVPDHRGVMGCGRTDTGVHARNFYAHFETDSELPAEFVYKMNAVLPRDISVYDCMEVAPDVHARFSATRRRYTYHVHFRKNPFLNDFSVFHRTELDIEAMNKACATVLGNRDFTSFSKSQTQVKHNFCELFRADWQINSEGMVFTVEANRFLRNMVRAMAGTMFLIGEGKEPPEHMKRVLDAMDRGAAGKSAYPQGLFLDEITYPQLNGTSNR